MGFSRLENLEWGAIAFSSDGSTHWLFRSPIPSVWNSFSSEREIVIFLRHNNIEIKPLITMQRPLSVQAQGRVTRLSL